MEGLENMAFIAIGVSVVTYFYGYMNYSLTKSATMVTNFMGTAFLLTLVGGFVGDTYLSRFKTCVIFACFELVVRVTNSIFFSFCRFNNLRFLVYFELVCIGWFSRLIGSFSTLLSIMIIFSARCQ